MTGARLRRTAVGRLRLLAAAALLAASAVPMRSPADSMEGLPPLPTAEEMAALWGPIEIAGTTVAPGERVKSGYRTSQSFAGLAVEATFVISRGMVPGPTLCLTAGIHGDELNGVEIVRRILVVAEPADLAGTLVGVPIANSHGFQRSSRYLPDRRDLNRYFPGSARGSAASRIGHALFAELVAHCEYLVDFHTGSFHRTNAPHIRADMTLPAVAALARQFGTEIVLHSVGSPGTLRRAATDRGLPCVTFEAGEPMRLDEADVAAGVDGSLRLLRALGMRNEGPAKVPPEQEVLTHGRWVRVDAGGLLRNHVDVGDRVDAGDRLGTVVDPSTNRQSAVVSPSSGLIVGMALDQVVIPGFAAYHLARGEPLEPGDGPADVLPDEPMLDAEATEDPEIEHEAAFEEEPE